MTFYFVSFIIFFNYLKETKNKNKRGKNTYLDTWECFSPKLALSMRVWYCKVLRTGLLLMKFIDQVPRFALKMRILMMTSLMVMSPSSAKPVLVLNLSLV